MSKARTSALNVPPAILLAGPTASGKSSLALRLGEALGGEVIGVDSLQVYRGLPLLTAAPDAASRARLPHHLCGVRSPARPVNVGLWLKACRTHMRAIWARGRRPILVGGSGLYFRCLTEGLAEIPPIAPAVRQKLEAERQAHGLARLWRELEAADGLSAARLKPSDRQRIVRALEVVRATGVPLSAWQARTPPPPRAAWRKVLLTPERAWLVERIAARLDAMLAAGLLQEVAAFVRRKPPPHNPLWQALGVKAFAAHLAGETSLEAARLAALQQTRQYAKRQMTWFRKYMKDWPAYDEQFYFNNFDKILSFVS